MRPTPARSCPLLIHLALALLVAGPSAMLAAASGDAAGTVAAAGSPAGAPSEPFLLEVGRPFPLIVLPAALDGRPLSMADFRGRKTILHIFASW